MRLRITKINKDAITQELRDVALKLRDNPVADLLITLNQFAKIFRIEPLGKRGRPDQIAETRRLIAGARWRFRERRERLRRR